jgi:hypothetical protein
MNLKKHVITLFPILWLFFFLVDFLSGMTGESVIFQKWESCRAIARGMKSVRRFSVFALIMMNVFLVYRWIGAAKGCRETKGA